MKAHGFWKQTDWVLILASLVTNPVIFGNLPTYATLQFSHLYNSDNDSFYHNVVKINLYM